ncbi:MAG TPA: hypothetical protein QGF58_30065 [Myxococcota bacterium]|nr:hypothetical protein [Myxococcota bacterium]
MTVTGELVARGTEITFTGEGWNAVVLTGATATFEDVDDFVSGSIIEHCVFEGGTRALTLQGASPYVHASTFRDNTCASRRARGWLRHHPDRRRGASHPGQHLPRQHRDGATWSSATGTSASAPGGVGAAYLRTCEDNVFADNTTDGEPGDFAWHNEELEHYPEWVTHPSIAHN